MDGNIRFIVLLTGSFLFSCKETKTDNTLMYSNYKLELLTTDRSFSELSEKEGIKIAYFEYIDSNGVLLRPNEMPIVGAEAIDYLAQQNDQDYSLTWDPQHAEVGASGDLGFTYGVYILKPRDYDTLFYGNYTNIWKKQPDGKWKLILNSGNEGLGN
jgi:ketosteroid isomerase-like protein